MSDKIKNRILCAVFAFTLAGGLIAHLAWPDNARSTAERRTLAQAPAFSLSAMLSGKFAQNLDDYALDQFPARDSFRTLKAVVQYYLLQQKDNNGVFLAEGNIGKLEYPLSESSVLRAAEKIRSLQAQYFPDAKTYLSLVPDKSYFLAARNGYPALDYERLVSLLRENTAGVTYIDIFDTLSADKYYTTDAHWRQECLRDTALRLAGGLGVSGSFVWDYKENTLRDFYGVYYGQAALPYPPDTLTYLTSPATESATVYNIETQAVTGVYDLAKLAGGKSMDMYDVFLSGASAVLTVTNPNAAGAAKGRELILFRDSFGSSIAPLLLDCYETVTLVDIRYIASGLLGQYVDFHGQDVLFLYSTTVVNNSAMLK